MKICTFVLAAFLLTQVTCTPYIARELCETDSDCLRGFPATIPTLVCSKSLVCEARNPHWCSEPSDCKDALTTCVANRCSHGARGAPCASRADCGIGHYCTAKGMCTHGTPGVACTRATAVECATGLTCSAQSKCTPGIFNERCVLDRNCADGLFCDNGRCAKGAKRSSPFYFAWGASPPLLPSASGVAELVMPSAEPINALGTVPESTPSVVSLVQVTTPPHNAIGTGPEPSAVPLVQMTTAPQNALGIVAPEPSTVPLIEVGGVNAALGVAAVPEPSAMPLWRKMGRAPVQTPELTEPLTVTSMPTAIPVPARTNGRAISTVSEIVVRA